MQDRPQGKPTKTRRSSQQSVVIWVPNQTNQTQQASRNSGATKQFIKQSKNSNIAVSDHQIPTIRHANASTDSIYCLK